MHDLSFSFDSLSFSDSLLSFCFFRSHHLKNLTAELSVIQSIITDELMKNFIFDLISQIWFQVQGTWHLFVSFRSTLFHSHSCYTGDFLLITQVGTFS